MTRTINPNIKPYLIGILLFLIIALVVLFSGCNPYKKVANDKHRDEKELDILAGVCAECFPVKETTKTEYKPGETVIVKDTSGYPLLRAKIDSFNRVAAAKPDCPQLNVDSVIALLKRQIKPEVHTRVDTTYIRIWFEDSAKLRVYDAQLRGIQKEYDKKIVQLEEAQKTAKTRLWWIIGLIAAIGVYVGLKIKNVV